jgi:hypothetical protein
MWIRRIIGTVLIAVGGVWIAQGTGALGGSFMSGEGFWAFMGAVAALLGIALLIGTARQRGRMPDSD